MVEERRPVRPYGETWNPEEKTIAEQLVRTLRAARDHVTIEVRRLSNGTLAIYEIQRHERFRVGK